MSSGQKRRKTTRSRNFSVSLPKGFDATWSDTVGDCLEWVPLMMAAGTWGWGAYSLVVQNFLYMATISPIALLTFAAYEIVHFIFGWNGRRRSSFLWDYAYWVITVFMIAELYFLVLLCYIEIRPVSTALSSRPVWLKTHRVKSMLKRCGSTLSKSYFLSRHSLTRNWRSRVVCKSMQ